MHENYTLWTCQKVCEALTFLLDNIYIRFGTELFRQIVGIPMGTNCAPLVADLFLFCYERDFMMSLSVENQSEIIEKKKVREKPRECHNHKPQPPPSPPPPTPPRGRGNRQIQTSTNRTNVRKALRLAPSSPSEVIAILKGLKTQEQNDTWKDIQQIAS